VHLLETLEKVERHNNNLLECNYTLQSHIKSKIASVDSQEIKSLNETIKEKNSLIVSLQDELTISQKNNITFEENTHNLETELLKFQSLYYDYKKFFEDQTFNLENKTTEFNNLKTDFDSKCKDLTIIKNKMQNLSQEHKDITLKYTDQQLNLNNTLEQLRKEIKKNSHFVKDNSELRIENNKNIVEINQLEERLNSIRELNKNYEKGMSS